MKVSTFLCMQFLPHSYFVLLPKAGLFCFSKGREASTSQRAACSCSMNRFVSFFACLVSIYALPRQQSAVSLQKEMETQGKLYRHNTPLLPEKERRRVHHLLERGEHAVGALPPREIAASSDSVLNPYTISYPDRFNKEPSHALPVSSNALPAHQAAAIRIILDRDLKQASAIRELLGSADGLQPEEGETIGYG